MKAKKIIALTVTLSLLSSYMSVSASTVSNLTKSSEMLHLRNAVLGITGMADSDDVNGDKAVNVFDIYSLKRTILNNDSSTGEFTTKNYSATERNVKLTGRTLHKDGITWLVQSGSAVEFTVTGKSAEFTLTGDDSIHNDENYRPRYAVIVDGEIIEDALMETSEKTISLFSGEVSRTAKVKIIHLSEAMNGAVGVKDISVTTDQTTPLTPEPAKDLSIEFIGDSITCAYGVEGLSSSEPFKTSTENFMKSYAYLTAQKLNADYSAVSYSGYGIVSGYTSGDINTDSLVPDCYGLTGKLSDYATEWDFASHSNDVVVINLGTNDYSYISKDSETRSPEFVRAYIAFLKTVREKNPDAYIICTFGTMGGEGVYPLIEQAVGEYSNSESDERIMCYQSAIQNQADGIGSDWHPSAITQQKSAYVLADKICQALGMESDQVGLDMASDAEYTMNADNSKGANASSFVGYDKSFWINTVTGGDSADAIEALISGITLKENGVYRLEFDYTSSLDITMPVLIRNADGKTFFSDEVNSTKDKQHFSAEFTADGNENSAEIAFQIGGNDYCNVTLSNISLIKTT